MRENIIRMAREAQFTRLENAWVCTTEEVEHLVTLVEDAQAKRLHDEGFVTVGHMRKQIATEREACAKVCESFKQGNSETYIDNDWADMCAAAIRARRQE